MGPLLWKPWLCGWQGHWPNPLSARVERCKQSLMDKSSKRRLWTFKSLRTSETSKGGLRFALRDDHEPSHGFLPQDHMVSTRFSVGGADKWVTGAGLEVLQPASCLPLLHFPIRLNLNKERHKVARAFLSAVPSLPTASSQMLDHSDGTVINILVSTFPTSVRGQKGSPSDWTRVTHHKLLRAYVLHVLTQTKNY